LRPRENRANQLEVNTAMPMMSGKVALMESLRAEGVRYIFGNPGTSEAPIMSALEDYPELEYVLTVQEGVAMGMADGYARRTGEPAFINLHIHTGLANGISLLSDSFSAGTPLVLTSGNMDARKLSEGRPDLLQMVEANTKWSAEVTHAGQMASVMRRAFTEARTTPTGPVFVGFAANALEEIAEQQIFPSTTPRIANQPSPSVITEIADLLTDSERPLMLVGERVSQFGATAAAVAVAEQIGAHVYSTGYTQVVFPTSHPQYMGMMSMRSPAIRDQVRRADVVLSVGTRGFADLFQSDSAPLAEDTKLIHIDSNAEELGRFLRTELAVLSSPLGALQELSKELENNAPAPFTEAAKQRSQSIGALTKAARDSFLEDMRRDDDTTPMSPARMMYELSRAWPENAIMVDDSISSRVALYSAFQFNEPGDVEGLWGSAIGWGMGAAMGVKMGSPHRPVIALMGDGTAMMTVQALWTAASRNIPVVFVICNNSMYRVLRVNMNVYLDQVTEQPDKPREYLGTGFDPTFDFAAIANAFGVQSNRIEDPADIVLALQTAVAANAPYVLDIAIDGTL
jgi:benzoylformate decarboxylase